MQKLKSLHPQTQPIQHQALKPCKEKKEGVYIPFLNPIFSGRSSAKDTADNGCEMNGK